MKPKVIIMAINGSYRSKNNTSILINEAIKGAEDVGDVEISHFSFAGKKINPCTGSCSKYCKKNAECRQKDDFQEFVENWKRQQDWKLTKKLNSLTDNAYFIHPMPIDRGNEVDDELASSPRSIIYDIAENRLHVQKAVMSLTMAKG